MNELWHKRHDAIGANSDLELCRKSSDSWDAALDGWAIFTGCDGESFEFAAFVLDEDLANKMLALVDPEDSETALFFDPCVVPAIVTPRGIIASNDYEIGTHEKLRAKLAESWWDEERLVSGCISAELGCGCPNCTGNQTQFEVSDG